MTNKEVKETWMFMRKLLSNGISQDYVSYICDSIFEDVVCDIEECADKDWNDDDMRLAIGRVLCERLGIER